MGFLDYYKQFQELSPDEVARNFRRRSQELRAQELTIVRTLDLTATTWWEPPHPEVVNQATFALRRSMNAYPDPSASLVREGLANRHGVQTRQLVVGHGAGELLQAAFIHLLHEGGEVVVPWPSWPVLPAMVRRAGGEPVAVPLAPDATVDLRAVHDAVTPATRAVVVCTPNDPTGLPVDTDGLRELAAGLPSKCWLLVDEALVEFRPGGDSATRLAAQTSGVVAFRSFSKAHAMAGFRVGYALGAEDAVDLLAALAPVQGVNAPAQDAIAWALENGDALVARRRKHALAERDRLEEALRGTSFHFPPAEAPFVWLSSTDHPGGRIAAHLAARQIQVMPGRTWGEDRHVRIALRDAGAVTRLAEALREPVNPGR